MSISEHFQVRAAQATREILKLISVSRTDPAPVFDSILENAAKLSGAPLANLCLLNETGKHWTLAAHFGDGLRHLSVGKTPRPLQSELVPALTIRRAQVVHIEDLSDTDLYRQGDPGRVAMVEAEGMRTILGVPLLTDAGAIGCITLFRREVRPFTKDEIELVETFASQAVIAIENVRQFHEVQVRLEREVATTQVLEVISRSRDNDLPVFDAILENAVRLCGADRARLMLVIENGKGLRAAGQWGDPNPALAEDVVIEMIPEMLPVVSILERRTVCVPDGRETEGYKKGVPQIVANIDKMRARSVMAVPLIRNDDAIGCIVLTSGIIAAYDENDVSLIETFASQAVIAIENVRQFRALERLNTQLEDRVRDQVDQIERMGKLKRFLPAAVADTVISSGSDKLLSSHRAFLGVLFCDIRGFTAFCETAEPEETIEVLQTYHREMGLLINGHGAGVDLRMGDGIMVLFNDPVPCDDPAGDAVRLAIAMRTRMFELSQSWKRMGYRLGFGVGVSLGYATVGMVGYEGRSDYTASGSVINLGSRFCEMAQDGDILLSGHTAIAVEDEFATNSLGEFKLKGIREPVEIFRLSVG